MLVFSEREERIVPSLFRSLRQNAHLRQSDLAERLKVPQSFISKVETGERRLDLLEARSICMALGLKFSQVANLLDEQMEGAES